MIDIHHHLLYGLDDGSPNIDISVAMAEAAAADGTTHIVCTPHANNTYYYDPEVNSERLAELQKRLGNRIQLGLGCDFHLSYENITDALKNPTKYSINKKGYLLVEFPDFGIAQNMADTFYELELAKLTPIITHPERNQTITRRPDRLAEWIRAGCLVQVTAGALTGRFGKTAEKFRTGPAQKELGPLHRERCTQFEFKAAATQRRIRFCREELWRRNRATAVCYQSPRRLPGR